MDQEATRAGELVYLLGYYTDREFFPGKVGSWQLQCLGSFGFVDIDLA